MNTGITIEVDGVPTDLADVSWAQVAPCGCICGLTLAWLPAPYGKEPVTTPEQAARSFSDSAKVRAQDARRGFTHRPVLLAQSRELMAPCEHTPKWGYERPTPDGYSWALREELARGNALLHLVPTDFCDMATSRLGEGYPLCGGGASFHWTTDRTWMLHRADCERCLRKAAAS